MPYRHLSETAAILEQDKRRQEPVHSLEHRDLLGRVRADDLEGATGVLRPVVSHHIPESVGDFGLDPLEGGVLAVRPVACHQGVILHSVQQQVEILRSGLKVGVHIADIFRESVVESGLYSRAESGVSGETDVEDVLVAGADLLDQPEAAVLGTIVHKQRAGLDLAGRNEL